MAERDVSQLLHGFNTVVFLIPPVETVFWAAALVAALIGTIAGFGFSSILLPVALSVFQYETALALVSIFHLFGNLGRVGFYRGNLDRRLMFLFGLPAVAMTFAGAMLVSVLPKDPLRLAVGLILVAYSALGLMGRQVTVSPTASRSVLGGGVYGFSSGLVGTGGPIRGAFLSAFGLDSGTYIATSGAISLLVDLTRVPVYLLSGFLTPDYYLYVPALLAVALVGSSLSSVLVGRIPAPRFRVIINVAIMLVSLRLVAEALGLLKVG